MTEWRHKNGNFNEEWRVNRRRKQVTGRQFYCFLRRTKKKKKRQNKMEEGIVQTVLEMKNFPQDTCFWHFVR